MRVPLVALIFIPALLFADHRPSSQLSENDITAIRSVDAAYVKAAAAQDWEKMIALFTPDIVVMPPNAPHFAGKESNLARLQSFEMTSVEYSHAPGYVGGEGKTAYLQGTYTINATLQNATQPYVDRGKYLWILKKQPNRAWLVERIIWNSDVSQAPANSR